MKKYIVYYEATNLPEGSDCVHYLDDFDNLTTAFWHLQSVKEKGLYKNVQMLKNIAYKVEISEVTSEGREPDDVGE
jgi:hypothetical protein